MKILTIIFLITISAFSVSKELPSKFENNLIYLRPQLEDGTTINFFTDTGGGWNAISKELTDKYQWIVESRQTENGLIEVTSMPSFDKDASIPLAGLNNWWAGKLQIVPNEKLSKSKNIDGVLGGRWHAEKIIDFNYPKKSIAILPSTPNGYNFSKVVLGFQKNQVGNYTMAFPRLDISVEGKTIPMLLDTGASAWPTDEAKSQLNLHGNQVATSFIVASIFDEWVHTFSEWTVIERACQLSEQPMIKVPKVKIADRVVGPVWFTRRADHNFHQYMSSMMDKPIDGALGGSALMYLRIIVDYPNELALVENDI